MNKQRGAISVEFAIALPILGVVMTVVFELLRVVMLQSSLTFALADVARDLRLKGDLSGLEERVQNKAQALSFVEAQNVSVKVIAQANSAVELAAEDKDSQGRLVVYQVSYPIPSYFYSSFGWQGADFKQRYMIQREGTL